MKYNITKSHKSEAFYNPLKSIALGIFCCVNLSLLACASDKYESLEGLSYHSSKKDLKNEENEYDTLLSEYLTYDTSYNFQRLNEEIKRASGHKKLNNENLCLIRVLHAVLEKDKILDCKQKNLKSRISNAVQGLESGKDILSLFDKGVLDPSLKLHTEEWLLRHEYIKSGNLTFIHALLSEMEGSHAQARTHETYEELEKPIIHNPLIQSLLNFMKENILKDNTPTKDISYFMGLMRCKGIGYDKDLIEAKKWIDSAANLKNSHAIFFKANLALEEIYSSPKISEIIELGEHYKALEKISPRHLKALNNASIMKVLGIGVEVDYDQAFKGFQTAAKEGLLSSVYNLSVCYRLGLGVAQNYDKENEYLSQAAELGHSLALKRKKEIKHHHTRDSKKINKKHEIIPSMVFDWEKSFPTSIKIGEKFFDLALENKHPYAHFSKAVYLEITKGRKEIDNIIKYYDVAIESNISSAMVNKAKLLINRNQEGDKAQAVELFVMAKKLGNKIAERNLKKL